MVKSVLLWTATGLILVVVTASALYVRDMNRAYQRIRGESTVLSSPYGDVEYTEGGSGPDVLVIHGGGGGYDQGELIAEAVLGERFHWIAPSRFGYLESTLPEGATWDDQAHAYAHLLDRLGVEKVAVVAMSQGGASALLFAVLHPDRVSSLACLSCGVAHSASEDQAQANRKGDLLKTVFTYDVLYWSISRLFEKQLLGMIGASDAVIARLTTEQRDLMARFIDYMNPVAPRSSGAAFDNEATLAGDRIAAITVPTVVVHAKDDLLQLYHNAEFAASTIPNARLLSFDEGGHIVMAVERATIGEALQRHILLHADDVAVHRP